MTDFNSIQIIGRLTHDVSDSNFRYTKNGTAVLNISIAVNRSEKFNNEWSDKVSFFDITVWGKQAENIKPFIHKGKQVAISGYLDQQRWDKDGQKFSKVVIIAERVMLLGGNSDRQQRTTFKAINDEESQKDYESEFLEDLPF